MAPEALRGGGPTGRPMVLVAVLALVLSCGVLVAAPTKGTVKLPAPQPKAKLTISRPPAPTAGKSEAPLTDGASTVEPTSREDLVRMLGATPGLLSQVMGGGATAYTPGLRSVKVGQMALAYDLARAYADGILLLSDGCSYSGGSYQGTPPLTYYTNRGVISPSHLRRGEAWVEFWQGSPSDDLFVVRMETPGPASQRLAYAVELRLVMSPVFDSWLRVYMNDELVTPVRSSSGSWVVLVELPGTRGGYPHRLALRSTHAGGMRFRFAWLKVTAM